MIRTTLTSWGGFRDMLARWQQRDRTWRRIQIRQCETDLLMMNDKLACGFCF